jgi:hypothetical protein
MNVNERKHMLMRGKISTVTIVVLHYDSKKNYYWYQ